jgi:hypothetical protein
VSYFPLHHRPPPPAAAGVAAGGPRRLGASGTAAEPSARGVSSGVELSGDSVAPRKSSRAPNYPVLPQLALVNLCAFPRGRSY